MSTRKHKRRRIDAEAQPLTVEKENSPLRTDEGVGEEVPEPGDGAQEPQPETGEDAGASAKERELWDAFREENYELLEQLPLSLHRAFTLIHELDQQAQENTSHIAPAILKYVSLRKSLAAAPRPNGDAHEDNGEPSGSTSVEAGGPNTAPLTNGSAPNGRATPAAAAPRPPTKRQPTTFATKSLASVVESSISTRELLVHIAQSAEEVTRACAEKVYLAQHAYDLVDRYIRDLDRAIKEQEASISLGLRPGTHPASIILPEVVVPQSSRGRVVSTPPPAAPPAPVPAPVPLPEPITAPVPIPPPGEPSEQPVEVAEEPAEQGAEEVVAEEAEPVAGAEPEPPAPPREKRKGKKRRKGAGRRKTAAAAGEPEAEIVGVGAEEEARPQQETQAPLTLRIPAQSTVQTPVIVDDDMPPDPNEPRYCFCHQVSFGDMIACDNPDCTREWFHIGCVGLTKIPKGNWYCRECAALRKRSKSRRRR
ncbi:hypothetical protein BV20DRAFT_1112460 [Pilatotrama ljubarskyi]|nr:hypothetical protein BV20DRAFT_1112460 [Pilatotrama ljubarskyi]